MVFLLLKVLSAHLGTDWTARIGDFNGDGKTDIFWHNATTGANTAWLMDGTAVSSEAFLPSNSSWFDSIFR